MKREKWTEADLNALPAEEPDMFERKSGELFADQGKFLDAGPSKAGLDTPHAVDFIRDHEQMGERSDAKGDAAAPAAIATAIDLGPDPLPIEFREQSPHGAKLQIASEDGAHRRRHPKDRIYTVMSGVFYIGLGAEFDSDKVKAYPPGCVVILPGDTAHFHWTKSGEYVTQVTAIGPLGLEYIDVKNDPRSGYVLSQHDGGVNERIACQNY